MSRSRYARFLIAAILGMGPAVLVLAQGPPQTTPPGSGVAGPLVIQTVPGPGEDWPGLLNPDDGPLAIGVPPGWWFGAELGVVKPSFDRLTPGQEAKYNTFLGQTHWFGLDWTVLPEVTAGYRFANGSALRLSYRSLAASGTQNVAIPTTGTAYPILAIAPPAPGFFVNSLVPLNRSMRARLDEQWLDLDYVSPDFTIGGRGWWRLAAGPRLASLFADFQVRDGFPYEVRSFADPSQPLVSFPVTFRQHASFYSLAAGAHAGLAGGWGFGDSGLGLLGRVDGGLLGAASRQKFSLGAEAILPGGTNGPNVLFIPDSTGGVHGPGLIPTLNAQAGLGWSVPLRGVCLSLAGGYEVQGWWFVATGHHASTRALFRHLDTLNHGLFLRCNLDF